MVRVIAANRNLTQTRWNDLHGLRQAGKDQLVLIKRNRVQICTRPPNSFKPAADVHGTNATWSLHGRQ